MPIKYEVTVTETGMSLNKLTFRLQSLKVAAVAHHSIETDKWSITVETKDDALKIDEATPFVRVLLPRTAIETLLDYGDASSNEDFATAIQALRKSYGI